MLTSAAPNELYRSGGWYDSGALLNELQHGAASLNSPEFVAEVFQPYAYHRPPAEVFGSRAFLEQLSDSNHAVADRFGSGAACALVRLKEGYVCGTVVYGVNADRLHVIYETYRPNEKHLLGLRPLADLRGGVDESDADRNVLFVGSAGSRNYGHWLVDDLPRLKAVDLILASDRKPVTILMQRLGESIDRVRADSVNLLLNNNGAVAIRFVEAEAAARVDNLYYVTPVSYHPHLKSPESISFIRDRLIGGKNSRDTSTYTSDLPSRIFVQRRSERGRSIMNLPEVADILAANGFVTVDPESLQFHEQVRIFSAAQVVVGTMGAAMTNTVFAPSSCRVMYLAPEGWVETFYWDLAALIGQEYLVVFGKSSDPTPSAHQRSFEITSSDLQAGLDRLLR